MSVVGDGGFGGGLARSFLISFLSMPLSRLVIPAPYPRHSRESGNPDGCSQARRAKSGMNSSADPFSLYGLTGAGFEIRLSGEGRSGQGMGGWRTKLAARNQV